jgi:hypothetical protein
MILVLVAVVMVAFVIHGEKDTPVWIWAALAVTPPVVLWRALVKGRRIVAARRAENATSPSAGSGGIGETLGALWIGLTIAKGDDSGGGSDGGDTGHAGDGSDGGGDGGDGGC